MADPKRIDLKVVNEDYVAPAGATPHQQLEARLAAAIKEGKRRANAELGKRIDEAAAQQIKGIKSAHVDELNRSGRIVAKAAHRDGVLQGIVLGMIAAALLAFSTWFILREVVITNVSTQRVPMAGDGVPELQVPESNLSYERDRREPADARSTH